MTGPLIYVAGPSGAGKDTLLQWAKAQLPREAHVHFARRTITREAGRDAEQHEAVDQSQFAQLLDEHAFAMHWSANGHSYGIRYCELLSLERGMCVIVNGSREYARCALSMFPNATLVHITASEKLLRERLSARGREEKEAIEARIKRGKAWRETFDSSQPVIDVHNDGPVAMAGQLLLTAILNKNASKVLRNDTVLAPHT